MTGVVRPRGGWPTAWGWYAGKLTGVEAGRGAGLGTGFGVGFGVGVGVGVGVGRGAGGAGGAGAGRVGALGVGFGVGLGVGVGVGSGVGVGVGVGLGGGVGFGGGVGVGVGVGGQGGGGGVGQGGGGQWWPPARATATAPSGPAEAYAQASADALPTGQPTRVQVSAIRANTRAVGARRVTSGPCTTEIMRRATRPYAVVRRVCSERGRSHDQWFDGRKNPDPPHPPGSGHSGGRPRHGCRKEFPAAVEHGDPRGAYP